MCGLREDVDAPEELLPRVLPVEDLARLFGSKYKI